MPIRDVGEVVTLTSTGTNYSPTDTKRCRYCWVRPGPDNTDHVEVGYAISTTAPLFSIAQNDGPMPIAVNKPSDLRFRCTSTAGMTMQVLAVE